MSDVVDRFELHAGISRARRSSAPMLAPAAIAAALGVSPPVAAARPIKMPVIGVASSADWHEAREPVNISLKIDSAVDGETVKVLGEALSYRKAVQRLLPADPEMDRLAASSLRRRAEGRKPRKVSPK